MNHFNKIVSKIGVDKILHLSIAYAITLTFYIWFGMWVGLIVGIAASFGKEAYDQISYGGWSWGDIVADMIGIAIFVLVIIPISA